MPHLLSRSLPALCLLACACTTAFAEEPSQSLYEKRLGIIKGTSKGIVVWGGDKPATTANASATAASGNNASTAGAEGKPASAAQQHSESPGLLGTVSPPSGRSLNDARRLGAVGGGIPLPTKATQAQQADQAAKP